MPGVRGLLGGAPGLSDPPGPAAVDRVRPAATQPSTGPGSRPASAGRLPALDGLRGVAALVVVVFHVLVLSPTFALREPGVRLSEPSWWLTHTPLYLLWAGPEAVYLFFVLSGFVLALPATVRPVPWRSYYATRLVRLYVPVWASLLLAAVVAALVPRVPRPELSVWYAAHVAEPGLGDAARDGLLLLGTGWLNSPLWSLQWEMWFSLLLPVYLLLAGWARGRWPLALGGALAFAAGAQLVGKPQLLYLSMFGFGVLMAFERDRLAGAAGRLRGAVPGRLLAVTCVLLLSAPTALLAAGLQHRAVLAAGVPVQLLGACLTVALALHWEPLRRRLTAGWAQWLGSRSFSLYLVHEPVVVSSGALWPQLPLLGHLLVVLPVGLLLAAAFSRLVERPAHLLARRAGRLAG